MAPVIQLQPDSAIIIIVSVWARRTLIRMFNQGWDAQEARGQMGAGDDDDAMTIITSSAYSWHITLHWGREGDLQIAEEESVEIGKHVSDRHWYAQVSLGSL